MGFTLDKIVPWGRSYDEYVNMFSLTETDLQHSLLGCGDGPAGFNALLTQKGGNIISIDPIYQFDGDEISRRIAETYDIIMAQLRQNKDDFVWQSIPSITELGRLRMSAMTSFLLDYVDGKNQGRYIAGELPRLPFTDKHFNLALTSHFLFLYSEQLSKEFHQQAIREMLRVAEEVRIFPLITLGGQASPHLQPVITALEQDGFRCAIQQVAYEFQKGGNAMLVIK